MNPHLEEKSQYFGEPLASAKVACILMHGRGAGARDMIGLAQELHSEGVAFICPQATNDTWFEQSLDVSVEIQGAPAQNALKVIEQTITECVNNDISVEKIIIGGFSQGACLTAEYAIHNPRKYGGLFVLSGCLLGDITHTVNGSLEDTPLLISGSTNDWFIPNKRIVETTNKLRELNAKITEIRYAQPGHTITFEELEKMREMIAEL